MLQGAKVLDSHTAASQDFEATHNVLSSNSNSEDDLDDGVPATSLTRSLPQLMVAPAALNHRRTVSSVTKASSTKMDAGKPVQRSSIFESGASDNNITQMKRVEESFDRGRVSHEALLPIPAHDRDCDRCLRG